MIGFFLEFGPLLSFFMMYKLYGLTAATVTIIILTILSVLYSYLKDGKVMVISLTSAILITIFGSLTLIKGDDMYIKMKPTLINLLFSFILFTGALMGRGLLKFVLGHTIIMNDRSWRIFSMRWAYFFLFLAILNEVVWRSFSTDSWVSFKVFGLLPLTIFFMIINVPFLKAHAQFANYDNKNQSLIGDGGLVKEED